MKSDLVLGFEEYAAPAQRLADVYDAGYAQVHVHRFPDGESLVRLPEPLPPRVIFCRTLDHPNDKLVELMLAAETAREQGAERLTLVAPYLCYMRQDRVFHPGEAVSQQIVGRWLAAHFDEVITVDPHLHRTPRLDDVLPRTRAVALSATSLLGDYLAQRVADPLLIGPDAESAQWVERIAKREGFDFGVAEKQRLSDRRVIIRLPPLDLAGRIVILVDDMVSTGHTLATAAGQALAGGAATVHCLVTHPLFSEHTLMLLEDAGIDQVWSTDSLLHTSNVIQLAPLLAEALCYHHSPARSGSVQRRHPIL